MGLEVPHVISNIISQMNHVFHMIQVLRHRTRAKACLQAWTLAVTLLAVVAQHSFHSHQVDWSLLPITLQFFQETSLLTTWLLRIGLVTFMS